MRGNKFSIVLTTILAIFTVAPLATNTWAATSEKVLYSFGYGTDGRLPTYAGVIFDTAGNLYGTTVAGGTHGYGTVFELTPIVGGGWTEKVLYSFCSQTNCTDGRTPQAGLIFDADGNLYGTASHGGTCNCGTVFELTPIVGRGWTEQVLHSFNFTDGYGPEAGLIFDAAGNLYGTTIAGGAYQAGTVFELTPAAGGAWTEQVLHSFGSGTDGQTPAAGLIFDAVGNLYSTTAFGGNYRGGTVFELTPTAGGGWTEEVLHNFGSGADGIQPYVGLIFDASGNLYGTTNAGGASSCLSQGVNGCGIVFELTPNAGRGWTEKVLHNFSNISLVTGRDGSYPLAGLIFDAAGNLYGTTVGGGIYCGVNGCGTAFELTPTAGGGWSEKVVHNFGNGSSVTGADGRFPLGDLIFDAAGNLYGTTQGGGSYGAGTVFEITP